MKILIQLEGFTVTVGSRTYSFQVTDESGESRQFRVKVSLESFRATPLKFQDGPLISRERLQQELDLETQEAHAKTQLAINDSDILAYMARHYPPKARNWPRVMPAAHRKNQLDQ